MIAPEHLARDEPAASAPPRATMRLQLHGGFDFDAAQRLVPYLQRLGVSHLFASPILAARSGSAHGYDVIDHGRVNPELGGEDGLRRLVAALRSHDMGLIVDIVPNHMAVGGDDNHRWLDVLEWGRRSTEASFFDIDWDSPQPALCKRVLVPFLGRPYGEVLDAGELRLQFDAAGARLYVGYFNHRFPLAPESYPTVLRSAGLDTLAERFRAPRGRRRDALRRAFDDARAALASLAKESPLRIDALLALYDPVQRSGRELLHELLEMQHYRLAWWRTAADQINWRRFFDISELAALRMQDPTVFETAHATILRLYADGIIDGLRVDHVDGLADPRGYCRRLRKRLAELASARPPEAPGGPAYIVVEKILAPSERLARDWLVDGTSGYAFMNDVGALLHDPFGEPALTRLWQANVGGRGFGEEERRARRHIARELFPSEFNACAHALHTIAQSDPHWRDWSLAAVRRVLIEMLAHFPVYRTYVDARGRSRADARIMQQVAAAAERSCRPGERPLVWLIDRWLGGEPPAKAGRATARRMRLRAIARFQQLTSPVAAKAVEDTAFYRHGRLLSRNEVGADPGQFSMSPADFHAANRQRGRRYPLTLLATATHDHKRGEDVRARLAVLSEYPQRWSEAVRDWSRRNAPLRREVDREAAPDDVDEYILYQMLIGCWPLDLQPTDREGLAGYARRLWDWQRKAIREAKRHGGWIDPNTAYEKACESFVQSLLDPDTNAGFLQSVQSFVDAIAPAGAVKSLTQTLLRMTVPGVPDLYQGTEWWDLSMVDPDNRRDVDFAARADALASASDANALDDWRSGVVKQRLIMHALQLRADHPDLFSDGRYEVVKMSGLHCERFIAFTRILADRCVLVLAPRFVLGLLDGGSKLRLSAAVLGGHAAMLPAGFERRRWRCVLDSRKVVAEEAIAFATAFAQWPVALFLSDS